MSPWVIVVIILAVGLVLCLPVLGIIAAIAVPSFLRAREISRRNACQESLVKIDGGKQMWALDNNIQEGFATPSWSDLVGEDNYIRVSPVCPSGGVYTIGDMEHEPSCSLSGDGAFPHTFPSMYP